MSDGTPTYIGFEEYTEHIPASIPAAVQQATDRFVGGRAARVAELPQWEELRQIASDIRLHTIENMDVHLTRFEAALQAAGGHIHWAATAEDARQIVIQIAKEHNVKNAVKSKSMATEEIGLNHALEAAGIETLETDLGEYIIQLAGTGPSHIIVPAVHLKKEEIADLFSKKLHIDAPADPIELARIARETLRQKFLDADMGISGANFLVAETGTLVMVTNEGNGRMVSTMPDLHVAVVGIDRDHPRLGVAHRFPETASPFRHGTKAIHLYPVHYRSASCGGRVRPQGIPHCHPRQRPLERAQRSGRARSLQVHSLRCLCQRLPGLQKRGRFRLWLVHLRANRCHFRPANARHIHCPRATFRIHALRGLCGCLPGQNPYPNHLASPAPSRGRRR